MNVRIWEFQLIGRFFPSSKFCVECVSPVSTYVRLSIYLFVCFRSTLYTFFVWASLLSWFSCATFCDLLFAVVVVVVAAFCFVIDALSERLLERVSGTHLKPFFVVIFIKFYFNKFTIIYSAATAHNCLCTYQCHTNTYIDSMKKKKKIKMACNSFEVFIYKSHFSHSAQFVGHHTYPFKSQMVLRTNYVRFLLHLE